MFHDVEQVHFHGYQLEACQIPCASKHYSDLDGLIFQATLCRFRDEATKILVRVHMVSITVSADANVFVLF